MKKVKFHVLAYLLMLSLLFLASCDAVSPEETSAQADSTAAATDSTDATEDLGAEEETPAETEGAEIPVKDGSFTTDLYTVTDVDGVCYLNFVGGNEATGEVQNNASVIGGPISFANMDEMYRMLSKGELTETVMEQMKRTFVRTEQGILVPNLNDLHLPVLPDGLNFSCVGLEGESYYVEYASENHGITGMTKFLTKDAFDASYASQYVGFFDNPNMSGITTSEGEFEGIPCTVTEYRTSSSEMRVLQLVVEQDTGRLSVLLQYCLSSTVSSVQTSETIPCNIKMHYEGSDGTYARITIPNMDRKVTLAWLKAFGTVAYVPPISE